MIEKQDRYYINLTFQIAQGSKCHRARFGALIVAADGRRIVGTGFNGKPAHSICDHLCFREGLPVNAAAGPCCLHAERNCLLFSDPVSRQGGTMYVSGNPCEECALAIMQAGLARLVFFDGADATRNKSYSSPAFWDRYGIEIERVAYTHKKWERLYGG